MKDGFIKITALSHSLTVANPQANAEAIIEGIRKADKAGSRVAVTPALGLCGSTVGDIVYEDALLVSCEQALGTIIDETASLDVVSVVGLPLVLGDRLYDAAAVVKGGAVLGVVAKRYLTASETRHFSPSPNQAQFITLCGQDEVPFGGTQVFACVNVPNLIIGVEFGDELTSIRAPHNALVEAGATVICNLAATPLVVGAAEARTEEVKTTSKICQAAYVYVDAGADESTTDYVFGGQKIIASCGEVLAAGEPFGKASVDAVVDVAGIAFLRRRTHTLPEIDRDAVGNEFAYDELTPTPLAGWPKSPFIPQTAKEKAKIADEILSMQAQGLAARLRHIHVNKMVLGVSGGVDSTLALLVCRKACDLMRLKASEAIVCLTLPCFGTTDHTKNNALALCNALNVPCREINIAAAVRQHLKDIGHDAYTADVTFENAQARMRTMVLMDVANQVGGLVIGTGDLSEIALGWCTYNGDHMSMYGVNATLPKTLMQCVIGEIAKKEKGALGEVLTSVLATPISPELLPNVGGQIAQKTEEIVGKYELNDFILYHVVYWGMTPSKLFRVAACAFPSVDRQALKDAFVRFYKRFFSQQFKRSCSVDGAKVGAIDLSPRGEWQMPSDISATAWLDDLNDI